MTDSNNEMDKPRHKMTILARICAGLFCFCVILFVAMIIRNWFLVERQMKIARATGGLRVYETALHTYKIDNDVYPPWRISAPPLTTPVQHLNKLIKDEFLRPTDENPGGWLRYASDGRYFIAWSVGPDEVTQISGVPDIKAGLDKLQQNSYDPSNGALSAGDLWRSNLGQDERLEPQPIPNAPCP